MVAENTTTLVGRAVSSLFMTRNRVVDKEMCLVRLALELLNFVLERPSSLNSILLMRSA
jgi:hypothetical protein